MMWNRLLLVIGLLGAGCGWARAAQTDSLMAYRVEAQASVASGDHTPLWLNANRYGLSSLKCENGYVRAGVFRPLGSDSTRRWDYGYGADMAVAFGYTSRVVVQQAFVEGRWLHGTLTVGSKEQPMELKNQFLSSGSQTLGVNARPVPGVRVSLPDYWTIPALGRWLHLKGHLFFGMTTDDGWQRDFTSRQSRYTEHALQHTKAGYLKIGHDDRPLSVEMGLEMAAQFGGTSYVPDEQGGMTKLESSHGVKAFWEALVPGGTGADETNSAYKNTEGNQLGSWVMRVNYDTQRWRASLYADHFFEDHSAMFHLDYDGYGKGDEWNEWKDSHWIVYDLRDIMLGAELNLKQGTWLCDVVAEFLYTKYQSGAVYHDRSRLISDHVAGVDNYYNHHIYTGWQHWGQVQGNPLYLSPLYNDDGTIGVRNNRFVAWHLGLSGQPVERLRYRVLATLQTGYGTYERPYVPRRHSCSFLGEATYRLNRGWTVRGSLGLDCGSIVGDNAGVQLTVIKMGKL